MPNDFAPPKLPRLHDALTLQEAADWLTHAGSDQWNTRAVLAALNQAPPTDADGFELPLLPEALHVVVPAGSELVNRFTGERQQLHRAREFLVEGEYQVRNLVYRLWRIGHAEAVTLMPLCGTERLLCESALFPDSLRLPAELVQGLLPAFDALVLDLRRGEYPELRRALNETEDYDASKIKLMHSEAQSGVLNTAGEFGRKYDSFSEKYTVSSRKKWQDLVLPYILDKFKTGQYATVKDLYRALTSQAGSPQSPFRMGVGEQRGELIVNETNKPLSLKTIQNELSRMNSKKASPR